MKFLGLQIGQPPAGGLAVATLSGSAKLYLRVNRREVELTEGQVLIGRADDCRIRLTDHLVSRRHARLLLTAEGRVSIQDLGSANGVLVNEQRVDDSAVLAVGDKIFVGTTELELVSKTEAERAKHEATEHESSESEPPPESALAPRSKLAQPSSSTAGATAEQSTREVDAFEYLGRLADKMFAMGRVDAAKRILATHLEEVLEGARRGRVLERPLLDATGHYAIKLAAESQEARFVDIALELHLVTRRAMSPTNTESLAALRRRTPIGNVHLLARYEALLQSNGRRTSSTRMAAVRAPPPGDPRTE